MLTDTSFWIDLLLERRERQAGPASHFLATHRTHELRCSIITWGELAEGFAASTDLESVLSGVRLLMLPRHIAWEASRIQQELAQQGRRLGENDCWIAGTARAWGLRLVSRDTAFQRVARLTVISY